MINSAGANGGIDGEYYTEGQFLLTSSGLTAADIGKKAYLVDNATVGLSSTNSIYVGRITEVVSATQCWVDIEPAQSQESSIEGSVTLHLNGGASKHDATEIDFELDDGSKKQVQAASDTVESAITDLDAAFGANVSTLTTTDKTLVGAINEVDDQIGDHEDGTASKHDASEVDFELADGSKKVVQAASDTVEAALTDIDAHLGTLLDKLIMATIAAADVSGGGTTTSLNVDLYRMDGATRLSSAVQVAIVCRSAQYSIATGEPLVGSVAFSAATKGSLVANGGGWAVVETDAAGEFDCTLTNADDETVWLAVITAPGVSDLAKSAMVAGCIPDSATWSA